MSTAPFLGFHDTFTVVSVPNHLNPDAIEQYRGENWIDWIWTDVTLEQYGRICRGMVRQDIGREEHFFFKSTIPVNYLIKWLEHQVAQQARVAQVTRKAVSTKLSDQIDCEDILGGTVTQDGGFCADLNKKPGKAQYMEKAAALRRRMPR